MSKVDQTVEKMIELLKISNKKILETVVTDRDKIENLVPEDKDSTVQEYIECTVKLSQKVEEIKQDRLEQLTQLRDVLAANVGEEEYRRLCFKYKIHVRREVQPTQNFKVENWQTEREREDLINKTLPRTVEEVDKDYRKGNLYTQLELSLAETERAKVDRKKKLEKAHTVVNMACGLVARIMRQIRVTEVDTVSKPIDVEPNNVCHFVSLCGLKFEKLIRSNP